MAPVPNTHAQQQTSGSAIKTIMPLIALAITGVCGFTIGTVRAAATQDAEIDAIRLDILKIRAMPEPSQVVTKDQLSEIVRRLDERTQQIGLDVQYLRQQAEHRGH